MCLRARAAPDGYQFGNDAHGDLLRRLRPDRQPHGRGDDRPPVIFPIATLCTGGSFQDHMMKKHPAIAVLEFKDIAVGMVATDAMLKYETGFAK